MNLGRCGSCDIYSTEYKCTRLEINVTTTIIITVKLSKKNPHSTLNNPELIHGVNFIKQVQLAKETSKKAIIESKQLQPIQKTVVIADPFGPKKRPKTAAKKEPRKGKKIIFKYIKIRVMF